MYYIITYMLQLCMPLVAIVVVLFSLKYYDKKVEKSKQQNKATCICIYLYVELSK